MQKQQTKPKPFINDDGLGIKKTVFVFCIVAGCFAILWPKLLYPAIFGNPSAPPLPQSRGSGEFLDFSSTIFNNNKNLWFCKLVKKLGKCCDVVLDKDKFFNASLTAAAFGPDLFRRHDKMYQDELSMSSELLPYTNPISFSLDLLDTNFIVLN